MRSERHAKVLLPIVAMGISLLLAEGAFRLFPVAGAVYRLAPGHLYEYVPGSEKIFIHQFHNDRRPVRVSIDASGHRRSVAASEPIAGRVVVYGDSFVAGEFSRDEDTLPSQLCVALRGLGVSADVVNAGVVGYGPDQVALRVAGTTASERADVTVVGVFAGNDFGDLIRNKLFRLAADGRLVEARPALEKKLASSFEISGLRRFAVWRILQRGAVSIPERLRSFRHARADAPTQAPPDDFFARQLALNRVEFASYRSDPGTITNLLSDGYDADVSLTPRSSEGRYKVALMKAVIAKIASDVARNGSRLLVVAIPAPHDLIPGYDGARVDRERFPDYEPARLTGEVARAAAQDGVAAIDLYPTFAAAAPEQLFFRGAENHWNEAGEQLAARTIAPAVAELMPRP